MTVNVSVLRKLVEGWLMFVGTSQPLLLSVKEICQCSAILNYNFMESVGNMEYKKPEE